MTQAGEHRDAMDIDRLLAEAARIVRSERYCWLATAPEAGGVRLRPMGKVAFDKDHWTVQFVTDGRSRKASDMRHANRVSLVYQREPDDAYITLTGTATLSEHPSEVRRRWKDAYDAYFPTTSDKENAAFVEVSVDRIELWIRGVTPEPFGLRTTILQRDAGGWRLTS
jgi:general stress protein 26